jgi:hypothetical protein
MIDEVPNAPKATTCVITKAHRPQPLRFITHHVQPKEAGGISEPENYVELCDSCHYTIHRLMWYMRNGTPLPKVYRKQLEIATTGYNKCVAAGTVDQIPNEG